MSTTHSTYRCTTGVYYTFLILIFIQFCQSRTELRSIEHILNRRSLSQQEISDLIDPLLQEEGELEDSFGDADYEDNKDNNYIRKVKSVFNVPFLTTTTKDSPRCPPGTQRVSEDGECVNQRPAVAEYGPLLINLLRNKYTTATTRMTSQFMSTRGRNRHPHHHQNHRSRRPTTPTTELSTVTPAISHEVVEMDDKVTMLVVDVPAGVDVPLFHHDDRYGDHSTTPHHTSHHHHRHDHSNDRTTRELPGRMNSVTAKTETRKHADDHKHDFLDSGVHSGAGGSYHFWGLLLAHSLSLLVLTLQFCLTFYFNY